MEDQRQHLLHTESATKHLQPLGVGDTVPRHWITRRMEGHLSYLCASMLLNIILAVVSLALMRAHAAPPAPSPHSTNCKFSKAGNASRYPKFRQRQQPLLSDTNYTANTRQITTDTANSPAHHLAKTTVHGPHWSSVILPTKPCFVHVG